MLDAPVQLVGSLEDSLFVGQWRIGDKAPWQKFEFSSQAKNRLFQGFFELVKSKNSRIKVEETFSFESRQDLTNTSTSSSSSASGTMSPLKEEMLSGQGSNQFGAFSISGRRNLITNEFTGEKRYTTWAGDVVTTNASSAKKKPAKRRRKKQVDELEDDHLDQLLPPLPLPQPAEVIPPAALLLPQPPCAPAQPLPLTNQARARKRVRDFVLQLPNRHVYPYDPLDLGNDLARKRYLQAQVQRPFPANGRGTFRQPRSTGAVGAAATSSLHYNAASSSALPTPCNVQPTLLVSPTNEPPALDLFRYPSTAAPASGKHQAIHYSSSATSAAGAWSEEPLYVEARFEADGSVYEGGTLNNLRHGFGYCGYWNGHLYVGNFKKGQEHGSGELRDASGALIYRGMFEYGRISGFGTMYYSDGAVFQGEFRESNRHGKGIIWYADGSYYDGDFFHGARSGFGKFVDVKTNSQYLGEWSNDVRHGTGRLDLLGSSSHLDGPFKDNLPDGRCFCQYANGDLYEGNFKEGLRDGRGTYTFANRSKLEGRFSRDEAIAKSGTLELDEAAVIELPHPSKDPCLTEWLTPIKDPNESHLTAGFDRDGT